MPWSVLRPAAVAALLLAAADARADLLTGVILGNRLVTFDSNAPGILLTNQAISGLQTGSGETIVSLDRRPADGKLYAISSFNGLYRIDPVTPSANAQAVLINLTGGLGLGGGATQVGMDFNPVSDFLRVTSDHFHSTRFDPATGARIADDSPVAYAAGDAHAGTIPSIVGLAYTNNAPGAASTSLYGIDQSLDTLVTQSPENAGTLHTVGSLGVGTFDWHGFDISGTSGTAFAAFSAPAANFSQLYSINLNSGTATLLGNIGNLSGFDAPITGLTGPLVSFSTPEPSSLTLVGLGGLVAAWAGRRKLNRQDAKDAKD